MADVLIRPTRLSWRQRAARVLFSRATVRASWVINFAVLLGTLGWILSDAKFGEAVAQYTRHIRAIGNDESALAVVTPLMWPRVDALWFVIVAGTLSAAGIVAGLVAGTSQHRNVRSWLAVMILLAGWLTLFTTWPAIAWRGQVWRVSSALHEFDELAKTLLDDWPTADGRVEGVGQFMAYPIGNPRTLMFVTTPSVPGTPLKISTIERGENDSLHFQLAGNEEGVWVVWQKQGDQPQAFFSGLDGEYIPMKYARLAKGWFLVRYIFAPTILGEAASSAR